MIRMNQSTQLKKKIWISSLLLCIAGLIRMGVILSKKNEALAKHNSAVTPLEYQQQLIDEITLGDQEILNLRERKKTNCEILGEDMPYSLLDTCGEPKKEKVGEIDLTEQLPTEEDFDKWIQGYDV